MGPVGSRIIAPMTQALVRANWIGPPSLSHRWMAGMLRMLAMLVSNLASRFGMRPSRPLRECHTETTFEALPQRSCEPAHKETNHPPLDVSFSGQREARIPRIPVLKAMELSTNPTAAPTGIPGARREACPRAPWPRMTLSSSSGRRIAPSRHPADFSHPDPAAGHALV